MKTKIGYKNGYKIIIRNSFYEVISGNRAMFFGYCHRNSTIEEIINKTILIGKEKD